MHCTLCSLCFERLIFVRRDYFYFPLVVADFSFFAELIINVFRIFFVINWSSLLPELVMSCLLSTWKNGSSFITSHAFYRALFHKHSPIEKLSNYFIIFILKLEAKGLRCKNFWRNIDNNIMEMQVILRSIYVPWAKFEVIFVPS